MNALMPLSISTYALAEKLKDPAFVVVDVRDLAAFNGWPPDLRRRHGGLGC
jgi:hypothetical protein